MRKSFEDIYMNLAFELAERSTCVRKKVGCVVTSEDYSEIFGIGYNGSYEGGPNSCISDEPGKCGCLHAEDNSITKVSQRPEVSKIVFVTTIPCYICAQRIINKKGVKKVYYSETYRCLEGKRILEEKGIEVIQIDSGITGDVQFSLKTKNKEEIAFLTSDSLFIGKGSGQFIHRDNIVMADFWEGSKSFSGFIRIETKDDSKFLTFGTDQMSEAMDFYDALSEGLK